MAVISTITRYQGASGVARAYAATDAITLTAPEGNDLHVCYAQLTGNMTINATLTNLLQFQRVFFHFTADTSNRTVTLGTGFINLVSSGLVGSGVVVPASSNSTVLTVYDGTSLRLVEVKTEGRGTTTESPAYAASIEVTDQYALRHIVTPAQLTGNLTLNATAVTKAIVRDEYVFHFSTDTSNRVVTFGTNFLSMDALTIPAGKTATALGFFNGTSICISSTQVEGRGTTTESPAYAASIEVTDQYALRHIVTPAQLTGALTLNATAVTKAITGDLYDFHFSTDGTQRIVTFGTNFLSSGTVTIPASKTATARGFFNGSKICITGREISA